MEPRPAEQPSLADIATQARTPSTGKWMSTHARVMVMLGAGIGFTKEIADQHPQDYVNVLKLESNAAHLREDLNSYQSQLNQTVAIVQTNIELAEKSNLGRNPNENIRFMYSNSAAEFQQEHKKRALELIQAREEITKEIDTYIAEKDKNVREIMDAMTKGKSGPEIQSMITNALNKQKDIKDKLGNLENNDRAMQKTLEGINNKIQTAMTAAGIIQPMARPPEAAPTPGKS